MVLKGFAVFDVKVGAYMSPFFLRTTAEALRSWEELCADGTHAFCKHPSDYTLFEIGSYDDVQGEFLTLPHKVSLGSALEVAARVKANRLSVVEGGLS